MLSFLALLVSAFWGLVKRKWYGKWLSVISLSFTWLLMLVGAVFRPSGPLEYYEYENNTQKIAGFITQATILGLFLLLILYLAFSKRVAAFLREEKESN